MQLLGCYLKRGTAPVTQSPADSCALKDGVQMQVVKRPSTIWSYFPYSFIFFLDLPVLSFSNFEESQDYVT